MIRVVACHGVPPKSDGRAKAEKARSVRVKHICHDLQRIAKQEATFSKSFLNDLIPFSIVWNESAMPFTIKKKDAAATNVAEFLDEDEFFI